MLHSLHALGVDLLYLREVDTVELQHTHIVSVSNPIVTACHDGLSWRSAHETCNPNPTRDWMSQTDSRKLSEIANTYCLQIQLMTIEHCMRSENIAIGLCNSLGSEQDRNWYCSSTCWSLYTIDAVLIEAPQSRDLKSGVVSTDWWSSRRSNVGLTRKYKEGKWRRWWWNRTFPWRWDSHEVAWAAWNLTVGWRQICCKGRPVATVSSLHVPATLRSSAK